MTIQLDPSLINSSSKTLEEAAQAFDKTSRSRDSSQGALLQYFQASAHAKLNAVG